jgi:hypothetical protein
MIDAYEPGIEFKNFPDLDEQINQYYDIIYNTGGDSRITPRYHLESGLKITQRDIFYYINRLYDNNPSSVIDVGCGECTWKRWFPNIIGFDPRINEFSQQDFIASFNADFSREHTKSYQCGMALNSLHFIPWEDIGKTIDMAMNIVQDRFLFTFNFFMLDNKPTPFDNKPMPIGGIQPLESLFNQIILNTGYKIILIDYPSQRRATLMRNTRTGSRESAAAHINGHVRFILAHNN